MESAPSRHEAHAFQLIVLLPFHPAVLEPDFDLSFRETQCVSYLYPPPPGQVPIEVELFLQLQRLVAGIRLSSSPSICTCPSDVKTHVFMWTGQRTVIRVQTIKQD